MAAGYLLRQEQARAARSDAPCPGCGHRTVPRGRVTQEATHA